MMGKLGMLKVESKPKKNYKESEEAIQDAVKEVIKKLEAQGILQG